MLKAAIATIVLATPLAADPLADAEAAYIEAWDAAPLSVRRIEFVNGEARYFGDPDVRASSQFAPNEPILVYVEPQAFGYLETQAGNRFGIIYDLRVLSQDGTPLIAVDDFLDVALETGGRPKELYHNLKLSLTGLPSDSYILELTLNDIASDKEAVAQMPFSVK